MVCARHLDFTAIYSPTEALNTHTEALESCKPLNKFILVYISALFRREAVQNGGEAASEVDVGGPRALGSAQQGCSGWTRRAEASLHFYSIQRGLKRGPPVVLSTLGGSSLGTLRQV